MRLKKTENQDKQIQQIAKELGIDAAKIQEFSETELKPKSNEICVFRQKLGLFVRYKK